MYSRTHNSSRIIWLLAGCLLSGGAAAVETPFSMSACLAEAMEEASDTTTIGELRRSCRHKQQAIQSEQENGHAYTAIDRRYLKELSIRDNRFAITAHKPNYILVAAHDTSGINTTGLGTNVGKDTETKFQVSMKFPLIEGLLGDNGGDIYAAYTNRSFWQVYDQAASSPFRETNHEPELWFSWNNQWNFLGFRNRAVRFGFNHQSNGQGAGLSRSWNRLFAEFIFENGRYAGALKTWWRIPEDDSKDDNPDIDEYMGYFELLNVFTHKKHSLNIMLRNNLRSDMHGAVQVDWNFPFIRHFDGYIQWFNGYGESLIDYNHNVNSIGIGVSLTDWL